MSATNPISSVGATEPVHHGHSWTSWLREPLVHFIVVGGLLFAFDHYLRVREDDPKTIVMGAEVDHQASQLFKAARGRGPNSEELTALRRVWLDNEVLYREGLALKVDKGDDTVRERVIFKALSIVDANNRPPPHDDNLLRSWFESHRVQYDEPARYDFQEAVMSGDNSEAAIASFVEALNAGSPADAKAGLRVFKGRPRANLIESYGTEFLLKLEASPPGEWRAFATRDGWRAMRCDSITKAKPVAFEDVRDAVLQDWTDAVMSEQRTNAVRALAKKYRVIIEPTTK